MSKHSDVGTVAQTVPKPRSQSNQTTSVPPSTDLGTVGTVSPICTHSARGNDNERARRRLSGNGPQLSQTVTDANADPIRPDSKKSQSWVVHSIDLIGVSTELARVDAPDYPEALTRARALFPELTLLVTLAGGKPRRRRDQPRRF